MSYSPNEYSLNEIETLAKRAARGAGFSWGLAEEAGKSVRCLAQFGLPGPELLASLLDANDGVATVEVIPMKLDAVWAGAAGRLCPIRAGTTLSDNAAYLANKNIIMQSVMYPLLLAPFVVDAASLLARPVAVSWDAITVVTDGKTLSIQGQQEFITSTMTEQLQCAIDDTSTLAKHVSTEKRSYISKECWQRLATFAHRTYAPASEESRLLGAGAGTTDND